VETDDDVGGGRSEEAGDRLRATTGVDARESARAARRAADRALVARLRVRDEAAYREFFLQHRGLLLELARRDGVRTDRREEIVGDFMAAIAMKLARPRSAVPESLAAYVATSFRHHLIDRARAASVRGDVLREALSERDSGEQVVASLSSESALHESSPGERGLALSPVLRALLRHIENETSEDERRLLRWLAEHVPQRQIAEWIGITHGAARLRVMRLRARLRESVLDHAGRLPPSERDEVMRLLGRADFDGASIVSRAVRQNEGRESDA